MLNISTWHTLRDWAFWPEFLDWITNDCPLSQVGKERLVKALLTNLASARVLMRDFESCDYFDELVKANFDYAPEEETTDVR